MMWLSLSGIVEEHGDTTESISTKCWNLITYCFQSSKTEETLLNSAHLPLVVPVFAYVHLYIKIKR